MQKDWINELVDLCLTAGISGREEMIRQKIINMLPKDMPYKVDNVGNLIVEIGSGKEFVALMAHMDEIGLLITGIKQDGTLTFKKIGGFDDRLLLGSHLQIITQNGSLDGVIGAIPPHLGGNQPIDNLTIDIGAKSKEEAIKMGVKVLDYAVFKKHVSVLNGKYISVRSLDDRFGCLSLVKVLHKVKNENLDKKVFFVWTVQEEIGLKGAKAFLSCHKVDICYAIDSFACCSQLTGDVAPGNGPVLRMADNSAIGSYSLMMEILQKAERNHIPIQVGVTGGGTDSSVAVDSNARMVPISLAVKYLHSNAEYISLDDFEKLVELLTVLLIEKS
ncbi:M42 family metallopeptidase [Pseudothermotoga thermarum]|uniref:Peptidase M42 family protein n=1 Tax=Pseudothermotoga thermarum DSM 5069 TaxID=688269 RepID=F7YYK9_9THEM|nr:M42 family metallopeptidase [Pseudothermotoga thermarum]AEH51041.1 peptidase M42 family protein [Pseudothermotoga thermarum DSM 5069]